MGERVTMKEKLKNYIAGGIRWQRGLKKVYSRLCTYHIVRKKIPRYITKKSRQSRRTK